MNKILFSYVLVLFSLQASPQNIESFMMKVLENHPSIREGEMLYLTNKAESRTGYTPPNPDIKVGYFPGIPSEIGDKITWSVSQTLDFPSRYSSLKILGENKNEQSICNY